MSYHWVTNFQQYHTAGQHHDEIALAFTEPGQRIRRVILYWKVWVDQPASEVLSTWLSWGVLSVIQWTFGAPLPIPDDVGQGDYDNRDLLDTQWTSLGASGVFNLLYSFPGGGGAVGHHDITPNRSADVTGGAVWWCWGLPLFTGAGIEVGHGSFWSRVLIETP